MPHKQQVCANIIKRCALDAENMLEPFSREKCVRIRHFLLNPPQSQIALHEMQQLCTEAIQTVINSLNELAQEALDQHCTPEKVANILTDRCRDIIIDDDSLNSTLSVARAQFHMAKIIAKCEY